MQIFKKKFVCFTSFDDENCLTELYIILIYESFTFLFI